MDYNRLFIGVMVFFLLSLTAIGLTSGWPYQLNLSNGVLYDTNVSNNATTNLTIYVVYQNVTYQNFTNITYLSQNFTNITCINCTLTYNETIHNQTYNKTEVDNLFVKVVDFNSYKSALVFPYPSRTEFDALNTKVTNMTSTSNSSTAGHGLIWAIIALLFCAIGFVIYMAVKGGASE